MTIKIITGFSNAGGSTVAFINLTNALNKSGVDCILYGPHQYHLDKCRADTMLNVRLEEDDSLIIHFFKTHWESRPTIKGKLIYSCHEKDIAPMNTINYKIFDKIHFVSENQFKWHNINYPHFILPNVLDELKDEPKDMFPTAGIIGSIDRNKQTHISIKRALDENFPFIYLFGKITDQQYYEDEVKPLIDGYTVQPPMYIEDKQKMYNMVSDVFLSSLSETWSYIVKECELTGTTFHGTEVTKGNFEQNMTNDEIVESWKQELNI